MPIRFYSRAPRAAPSFVVRPTRARDEALQKQMEAAFSFDWVKGVERLKRNIDSDTLAKAYVTGDYKKIVKAVPFNNFGKDLSDAIDKIGDATGEGAMRGAAMLPKPGALRYDLKNPDIVEYIDTRSGSLVQNVTDEFQIIVARHVKDQFDSSLSQREVANRMVPQLRSSIGLDDRRNNQLERFRASGASSREIERFRSRLLDARAITIARTEMAYALNFGQLQVWQTAEEQGLLSKKSRKVWSVDGRPCPNICQPMDGIAVPLYESFLLPDGVTVPAPPGHVNCRCLMRIEADEDEEAPGNAADDEL